MEQRRGGGFGGGRRRGRGRGRGRPTDGKDKSEWTPITKLGRLVHSGHITSLEEVYKYSLPIKEPEIIDFFLKDKLKDEVMKIKPVQKQTRAGQRTRFRAIVAIGDCNGHIGVGTKVAKEVATAIRGAITNAKVNVIPVKFGFWFNKVGKPHTVPAKVSGKCGSVLVRLIPAPRGAGLVAAPVPKRLLEMAGMEDCFTNSRGKTSTVNNFAMATFKALKKSYSMLTEEDWPSEPLKPTPFQHHSDFLSAVRRV